MRCARDDGDGPIRPGPGRETTVGRVAAWLESTPLVVCPAGHADAAPLADAMLDTVATQVVRSRLRRLRGERCGACGAALDLPGRRTHRSFTRDRTDGVPVVTVTLDVPSVRCPDCGTDQLPAAVWDDLAGAVRELFRG